MKKIKYIALGAFATLLSSCGNDWLDLQSSTAIETDGSLTELRDFEFVLNGAYSSMQSSSYYGADMFCYGDLRGDDMKSYKSSSTNVSFYTFKYNKTNGPSGFWGMYYGIGKNLNILFRDIEKIKLVPDREITTPKLEKLTEQEYYNDLKGEALAIRALLLFDMTRIYGYPYLKDNGASLAVPFSGKAFFAKSPPPAPSRLIHSTYFSIEARLAVLPSSSTSIGVSYLVHAVSTLPNTITTKKPYFHICCVFIFINPP